MQQMIRMFCARSNIAVVDKSFLTQSYEFGTWKILFYHDLKKVSKFHWVLVSMCQALLKKKIKSYCCLIHLKNVHYKVITIWNQYLVLFTPALVLNKDINKRFVFNFTSGVIPSLITKLRWWKSNGTTNDFKHINNLIIELFFRYDVT